PIEAESSTVVRLMTIHQAKGLEFPVVVVPDLARNPGGPNSSWAFDPELGPLVSLPPGAKEGACGFDLHRLREREEEANEEVRLLYGARTRAADHLILSAGLKDLDKPSGSGMELLAERFDIRTGALKVALPAGYNRPKVAVTLKVPRVTAAA